MKRLGEQQQATSNLPAVRLHDGDSTLIIDRFKPIHINFYVCEVEVPATSERYVYVFQVYLAGKPSFNIHTFNRLVVRCLVLTKAKA